jgi:hypothetical protein
MIVVLHIRIRILNPDSSSTSTRVLLFKMPEKEFGLNPATLAGFTSDGASIMVAAGRDLKVIPKLA